MPAYSKYRPDANGENEAKDFPRVLLLLARESLNSSQKDFISRVICRDRNIDRLRNECKQRLISPIATKHILDIFGERWEEVRDTWVNERKRSALYSIRRFSELAKFHERYIESVCASHIFFKGPSIAVEFYAEPAFRVCRDIDVLISEKDSARVIQAAIEDGYEVFDANFEGVAFRGAEAVVALAAMNDVVTLRSPNGIFFEIHKTLDRRSGLFPNEVLFEHQRHLNFFGRSIGVLPAELLFCYVVYHATQHTWARLNWFTDVHAILTSEHFDLKLCRSWADSLGLISLVDACIELDDWCNGDDTRKLYLSDTARSLYEMYEVNIEGGLDTEVELILAERSFGLAERFRASAPAKRKAFVNHIKREMAPRFVLYCKFPMKRGLWWLYSLLYPPFVFAVRVRDLAKKIISVGR